MTDDLSKGIITIIEKSIDSVKDSIECDTKKLQQLEQMKQRYLVLSPEHQLAIYLHAKTCPLSHGDHCKLDFPHCNVEDQYHATNVYMQKATKMLEKFTKCANFNVIALIETLELFDIFKTKRE